MRNGNRNFDKISDCLTFILDCNLCIKVSNNTLKYLRGGSTLESVDKILRSHHSNKAFSQFFRTKTLGWVCCCCFQTFLSTKLTLRIFLNFLRWEYQRVRHWVSNAIMDENRSTRGMLMKERYFHKSVKTGERRSSPQSLLVTSRPSGPAKATNDSQWNRLTRIEQATLIMLTGCRL